MKSTITDDSNTNFNISNVHMRSTSSSGNILPLLFAIAKCAFDYSQRTAIMFRCNKSFGKSVFVLSCNHLTPSVVGMYHVLFILTNREKENCFLRYHFDCSYETPPFFRKTEKAINFLFYFM